MGNQGSAPANIFVMTDKPYFTSGDSCTGHVYI